MSAIFIDTTQLTKGAEQIKQMSARLSTAIDDVCEASALAIELKAKQLAPADRGYLRQGIHTQSEFLKKQVQVVAEYAAFVEFGTGKYAAEYASSLPDNWRAFAQSYKGIKGGGTFKEMVRRIAEWIKRKGFTGTYSVKTRRRSKSAAQRLDDYALAYVIARSILIKGVKPHPFLFPAYQSQLPTLEREIADAIKQLK